MAAPYLGMGELASPLVERMRKVRTDADALEEADAKMIETVQRLDEQLAKTERSHSSNGSAICGDPALAMKLGSAAPYAADTPPAADLEMVLDTSMSEVLLQEDDFKRHVAADISRAVGCDASQVEVVGIEAGSIMRRADGKGFLLCGTRVKVGLATGAGESRLEVARELERQAGEAESALMQGRLTRKCRAVRVTVESSQRSHTSIEEMHHPRVLCVQPSVRHHDMKAISESALAGQPLVTLCCLLLPSCLYNPGLPRKLVAMRSLLTKSQKTCQKKSGPQRKA